MQAVSFKNGGLRHFVGRKQRLNSYASKMVDTSFKSESSTITQNHTHVKIFPHQRETLWEFQFKINLQSNYICDKKLVH